MNEVPRSLWRPGIETPHQTFVCRARSVQVVFPFVFLILVIAEIVRPQTSVGEVPPNHFGMAARRLALTITAALTVSGHFKVERNSRANSRGHQKQWKIKESRSHCD